MIFSENVPEVVELVDGLKIGKFYVSGHSCGGVLAMQIAAAQPERVLGLAVISSPGNIFNPSLSKADRKMHDPEGNASVIDSNGCMGAIVRKLMDGTYYHPDKSKDFGFAGGGGFGGFKYYIGKETGGCPNAMLSDHYFVSKILDAELHGSNTSSGMLHEMRGVWSHDGWSYDITRIKCPTFVYGELDGEVPTLMHKLTHKLIPGSELILWQAHGHLSIAMEVGGIFAALVQGKSFPGDYGAAENWNLAKK